MCDCYMAKCANCDCEIPLHIADFCTPRENVIPYCPRCSKKIAKGTITAPEHKFTVVDVAEINYGKDIHIKKGDRVCIFCTDENAHGIHLN